MEREPRRDNSAGEQFVGKSYYEILGVSTDASQDDIRDAFIQLSKEHHPDAGGEDRAYQWISEAYTTLKTLIPDGSTI